MQSQELESLKSLVRNIPDFPVPGVQFKDLTTLLKNREALAIVEKSLVKLYERRGITKVAGIESRGFIGAGIMAARLGAGFVPVRKPGKLPAETLQQSYEKEYGTDIIEIHKDAIEPGDIVLIHDDLLATGGTMLAAYELVKSMRPAKIYINFLCSISALNGLSLLPREVEVTTLFDF